MVATTMFTPGGSHPEREIPAILERARERHPTTEIQYAWPFDLDLAAEFLAKQMETFPAQ
jgi:sirohydrochlorin cobaltochelatase